MILLNKITIHKLITKVLVLIIILAFGFCKKDKVITTVQKKDVLPEATQEGKNTFGCLVNGEVWLPKIYDGSWNIFGPRLLSGGWGFNKIGINARKVSKTGEVTEIFLYSKNINKVGDYNLYLDQSNTKSSYSYRKTQQEINDNIYPINDTLNSSLVITRLDTINKIISGKFAFNCLLNNQYIQITNGVFDLKF